MLKKREWIGINFMSNFRSGELKMFNHLIFFGQAMVWLISQQFSLLLELLDKKFQDLFVGQIVGSIHFLDVLGGSLGLKLYRLQVF